MCPHGSSSRVDPWLLTVLLSVLPFLSHLDSSLYGLPKRFASVYSANSSSSPRSHLRRTFEVSGATGINVPLVPIAVILMVKSASFDGQCSIVSARVYLAGSGAKWMADDVAWESKV